MPMGLGVSHARVSALVALTRLFPRIKEVILDGADDYLDFATLFRIAGTESWRAQEELAEVAIHRQRLWGAKSLTSNIWSGFSPERLSKGRFWGA
jgi:hypothetical protein